MTRRPVAIFDADLAPAVAFARSLGRAGVPFVVYRDGAKPAAQFSRYTTDVRPCPPPRNTDVFVDWLTERIGAGDVDLVAPTSDYVVFALAEAHERLGQRAPGHPTAAAVRRCLFKDWFADAMAATGLPAPAAATPTTTDEAAEAAEQLGFPVVVKPRSHIAVGNVRGRVATHPADVAAGFGPLTLRGSHTIALGHHPALQLPFLQRYLRRDRTDVVSVAGCLGDDGRLLTVAHTRKVHSWPPDLGIGIRFALVPEQPFTADALQAVRDVLGVGLFELEVLVERDGSGVHAIDLNPRGFGQMSLYAANGHDLVAHWYETVTGDRLGPPRRPARPTRYWQVGVPYYAGAAVGILAGPARGVRLREVAGALTRARVGPMFDWRDPLPGVRHAIAYLRHPGGLVRPFHEQRYVAGDVRGDRPLDPAVPVSREP